MCLGNSNGLLLLLISRGGINVACMRIVVHGWEMYNSNGLLYTCIWYHSVCISPVGKSQTSV